MRFARSSVRCLALFIFTFFTTTPTFAQSTPRIRGKVRDTSENKVLANASVVLIRIPDSVITGFTRTDATGGFSIASPEQGKHLLLISYPKYADFIDTVQTDGKDLDVSFIMLNTKAKLLKEIIIKSNAAAIRIKGDTTEFRADSFMVTPNADVQELLRKMPGFQVNAKGEITAQGRKVNKVLVDGEEFFSDDPAVVTRNLRADAVDKVQLFDKQSDQAAFTGIDDGEKTRTINLQLKEEKKNGYFGKAEAGSDLGDYANGKLMANAFKGKRKIAGYLTTDNTQFEALSWDEARNYGDGGNSSTTVGDDGSIYMMYSNDEYDEASGLPNQQTAGLSYANKWGNTGTNNALQYQRLATNSIGSEFTKTILPDSSFINRSENIQDINKRKAKFSTTNEWGTDSTGLFKITLKGVNTIKDASANYTGDMTGESGAKINESNRKTSLHEDDKLLSSNITYRKKLAKTGRTLSFASDLSLNDKTQDATLLNTIRFIDGAGQVSRTDLIDQQKQGKQNSFSSSSNITYTEPLAKKSSLILKYSLGIGRNDAEMLTMDNNGAGEYIDKVDALSNHFIFNTINNTVSANYRFTEKKKNFIIGSGIGKSVYMTNDLDRKTDSRSSFTNFIPSASFTYSPRSQRRLKVGYNGNTVNPTLQQIQPIANNNDPLNILIGNADLRQAFNHQLSFDASDYKVLKSQYINLFGRFNATDNAITGSSTIDNKGQRISTYVNTDGNMNSNANARYGRSLSKGINGGLNISHTYNRYVNYVNGVRNRNDNSSLGISLDLNVYNDKWLGFYCSISATNNTIRTTLQPDVKTNYWSYSMWGNLDLNFKKIKTYVNITNNFTLYQKTSTFTDQRNIFILSPSVRKTLTKNDALEAKVQVFDLLNQNSYVNRNISSNFISETTNNGVGRFAMLGLIYNFNKNGKPQQMF